MARTGRPKTHDGICSACRKEPSRPGEYRCAECKRAYSRNYRAAHPGREREQARQRYWADPERSREIGREKYARYQDRFVAYFKAQPKAFHQAHWRVHELTRSGRLERPAACPKCGGTENRIEAHHPDHAHPEIVEWMCSRCHGQTRRKEA